MTSNTENKTTERQIRRATEWNKVNKEKRRIYVRKYFNKIRDKLNKYNREIKRNEYQNDANKREKAILMAHHKNFMNGERTFAEPMIGLSLEEYKAYIQTLLPKGCTFDNYGKKWQIRRKKTIKEFDLTNKDEANEFMNYKNIYIYEINKE